MFPGWLSGKESTCQSVRHGFDPGAGKIRYRRKWQPTPVFLPLKSHGQRSLAVAKTRTWLSDWVCAQTYTFPVYVTRRRLPSRAQEWALVYYSEMNCWRRHMGWQSKIFYWEGGEQWGKGTQENYSATWLSLRFYGNRVSFQVVSGQSLLTKSPSQWYVHRSSKIGSSEKDSGRLGGHMDWSLLSPFDLSWILPVGGSLLVPHSLLGLPVVR